ncbi:Alpha/Beta hydrolase protein [Xylaria digitata]|nr:Alpha/Beta hydrolase protein [Xylaria digitata]
MERSAPSREEVQKTCPSLSASPSQVRAWFLKYLDYRGLDPEFANIFFLRGVELHNVTFPSLIEFFTAHCGLLNWEAQVLAYDFYSIVESAIPPPERTIFQAYVENTFSYELYNTMTQWNQPDLGIRDGVKFAWSWVWFLIFHGSATTLNIILLADMLGSKLLPALWSIGFSLSAATSQQDCPIADVSAIAHTGNSVGQEVVHNNVTLYVTGEPSDKAVLYLTDIFGIQLLENRLLADSFGRAGYFVVAPDLFNGTPSTLDLVDMSPTQLKAFLAAATPEETDSLISVAVDYLKNVKKITKIAATGYCFGGRYTFRWLSEGTGINVGFAAHPSNLQNEEINAIRGAVGVAAADNDGAMPPTRRAEIEALLLNTTQPYSLALYGSVSHGFGVRANVSDPRQKFGKEQAFFQAVRWFDTWL